MKERTAWRITAAMMAVNCVLAYFALQPKGGKKPPRTPPRVEPVASVRTPTPFVVAETIYDGRLAPGWDDWGWGKHELVVGQPAKVDLAGYGGIHLHHQPLSGPFAALVFRFQAPKESSELDVSLKSEGVGEDKLPRVAVSRRHVANVGNGWSEALVPFAELNPTSLPVDGVIIKAKRFVPSGKLSLDKIVFTKPAASASAPVRPAALRILCDKPSTAINPLVYGIANGAPETGATGRRIGGNTMTRLNWDIGNVWNTGNDWFFRNVSSGGDGLKQWLDGAAKDGMKMALVVPMIGWVAKDATSVGFPKARFGEQRKHAPDFPEAGDGYGKDGQPLAPGPPTQTSVPAPPELIEKWVKRLREWDEARGARGVHTYILDNEPSLWNSTHRDVHPDPVGYDELLDRTLRYGAAIRRADPDAVIAGPADWGWTALFYSAKDQAAGWMLRPDRLAHGGVPLLPWYLGKLADAEKRTGVRILDLVDVHFYPAAERIYANQGQARTDPEGAALRLRSIRALWDPTYKDESWINEHVNLIPRLKDWIAKNYPGRGIMIGEWNFGAEDHISGGLATAEALGRFGQQGISAAYYWREVAAKSPGFWAFRSFRNFDGKGARFEDESIPTEEVDPVSLFASRNAQKTRLVAVLVNKDPSFAIRATIDVSSCGKTSDYRSFVYPGKDAALSEGDVRRVAKGAIVETLSPYSITILELSTAAG